MNLERRTPVGRTHYVAADFDKYDFLARGWIDAEIRPADQQRVVYFFEPFRRFYSGVYDRETDTVAGKHGFTSWLPEVVVWRPLAQEVSQ